MKGKFSKSVVILIVLAMCSSVFAGILMVSQNENLTKKKDNITTMNTFIEKDKMRVETTGKDRNGAFIYRMDKEVFWMIDFDKKEYTEITKQELEKITAQLDSTMKVMKAQMENAPAFQRKMLEKVMNPMKMPDIKYKKIASGENVNQWTCDKYEGYSDDKKMQDVWTTDWSKLGLKMNEYKVLESISEFFKKFAKDLGSFYNVSLDEVKDDRHFSGLPVKSIIYDDEKPTMKTELKEIKSADIDPSKFEIPAGFKKKEFKNKD